jgi:hypothetical protein
VENHVLVPDVGVVAGVHSRDTSAMDPMRGSARF